VKRFTVCDSGSIGGPIHHLPQRKGHALRGKTHFLPQSSRYFSPSPLFCRLDDPLEVHKTIRFLQKPTRSPRRRACFTVYDIGSVGFPIHNSAQRKARALLGKTLFCHCMSRKL